MRDVEAIAQRYARKALRDVAADGVDVSFVEEGDVTWELMVRAVWLLLNEQSRGRM